MNQEVLFVERQKFNQWWLWLILVGINGRFLFGLYNQLILGEQFGNKTMSDKGLLFMTILMLFVTVLFFNFRLETQIKSDGIYVRFFPFHLSFKHFDWDTLTKSYVRKYGPISEFGGWGLRISFFGKGKAYNISSNKGLQIEFLNHNKLLIGTKKPEELTAILERVGQQKK